jgi:hypothetical protein
MHPDDDFCFADETSRQSFITFMDFMEAMGWTLGEYYAEKDYLDDEDDEPMPDPEHDKKEFFESFIADDYYAELQKDYEDTIYSLKYSF